MRHLTVKKLREIINEAPEDAYVLIPGEDHSLSEASAYVATAMRLSATDYTEDCGEEWTPEGDEFGVRVPCVIIS